MLDRSSQGTFHSIHLVKTIIICFIVVLLIFFGKIQLIYASEFPTDLLTKTVVEERIERLKNDNNFSDTEKQLIIAQLQLILTKIQTHAEQTIKAQNYSDALATSAAKQAEFEKQLTKLKDFVLTKKMSNASLVELEGLVAKDAVELATLRKRLEQVSSDIRNERSFDIQVALEEARRPLKSENTLLIEGVDDVKSMLEIANNQLQQAKIKNLEQRLLSRNQRLSLWESEQRLLTKQIIILESRLEKLQTLVTQNRQTQANQTMEQAKQALQLIENQPQVIVELAQYNISLANEFNQLIADQELINRQKEITTAEIQKLQRKYTSLTEQLAISQLGDSPEFGAALRIQRDQLTDVSRTRNSLQKQKQDLIDNRLAQFRIDALRELDTNIEITKFLDKLKLNPEFVLSETTEKMINDLFKMREVILEKLSLSYWNYISALTSLNLQNSSLLIQSKQYTELLEQQLLWMPSSKPVGFETFASFAKSVNVVFDRYVWQDLLNTVKKNINNNSITFFIVILLILIMRLQKYKLVLILSNMKDKIGKVNKDKMYLTFIAMLVTLILALSGPVFLMILAFLVKGPTLFSEKASEILTYTSLVYLTLNFVSQGARKDGLLELHFKWSSATVFELRKNLRWFMAIIIPTIILNLLIESIGNAGARGSLGRVAFIVETLAMAFFAKSILLPRNSNLKRARVKSDEFSAMLKFYSQMILIILIPIVLIGISIFGYHYTAVQLESYLLNSALVILLGWFVFSLALRAFAINERRLALDRLRAKRAAAIIQNEENELSDSENDSGPSAIDLQTIDLQTISKQTKALLKLVVSISVALALWNVWSSIFPAFKPLVNVELWQVFETVGGVQTVVPITLWNLLLAVVSIIITFLAARNLSGVLESALFSRMNLQLGTGYAITTVAQYIIVIIGTVVALQWLGAQWSKVQWLVAALSVGLGFGLQEIVANFVSGIVILFEKPIRIGDTVTVGDQWGSVTRIRMRATTLIDWDRREIIVPNKSFTSEKLTNWTLTDPITRRKIEVGVAYGSDVDLVEATLLRIAAENPKVLNDPIPEAYFLRFGESSLEFTLRVFVRGYREHAAVAHELHKAIDREFRALGIEIAFPQTDIHFDPKPIEVRLIEQDKIKKPVQKRAPTKKPAASKKRSKNLNQE